MLLAVCAVVAVRAIIDGVDTTRTISTSAFRWDAEHFLQNYRCLEREIERLDVPEDAAVLDTAGSVDGLVRYLVAMAAIGVFEIDGGPGAPIVVATTDSAAPCGLRLTTSRASP